MVFFLEDPLTGDVPHRGLVEEEDEQQATEVAPQYDAAPEVQWSEGAQLQKPTVVFLVGQSACLLADAFFPGSQAAGAIAVPELVRVRSPMEEEYGPTHKPLHTCTLRSFPTASPPLLLVACPRELPAEQAGAWARAVLAALRPAHAVVVTTLPVMQYRGPGSPADEDLVFCLQTKAAEEAAAAAGSSKGSGLPPALPEATLVGGLPAALLTDCELAGLPAALITGVQQQQVPDAQFLFALGRGAQAALASLAGSSGTVAGSVGEPGEAGRHQLLAALGAAADSVYRSSASSSIFS